ncbi:MAG: exodeoxyribonuclease VII small subunit [Verrucomicrobiaceae bacterium]|nr:exodeoxyribonuclease VII small subunit [Verrucomicrobiaceae bacterium]
MSQPVNDETSFEDAMQRLDEIVGGMESDRLPLEDMITGYEEGIALLKVCRQRLEQARHRVELISANLDGGQVTTRPFDPAEADAVSDSEATEAANTRPSPPKRRKSATDEEIRLF